MNMNDKPNIESPAELPPELAAISSALDHLASTERASMPPGFADRVYFRTAAMLRPHPIVGTRPVLIGALRVAAVLAVATAGVLALMNFPAAPREIAGVVARSSDESLTSPVEEPWDPIPASTLADVKSELNELDSALDSFWSIDADWLDEESM